MVIYADILFLVNLYVDYFLLLGVKNFLHLRAKSLRLLLGSGLGGLFSLTGLFYLPEPISYLLSVIFAGLMVFAAFSPADKKAFIKALACYWAFSFIFAGIVLLLSQITAKAVVIGGKPYFDLSPILLFLFTVLSYFVSILVDRLRGGREPDLLFCRLLVEHDGKQAELFAKADTGSTLKEPFSGLPVLVAERAGIGEFLDASAVSCRLVPYNSIGGEGLLSAFKPDKVTVKKTGKELNCYLAIYDGRLSAGSWNCLLNPELLQ